LMHLLRIKLHYNKVWTTTGTWKPVVVVIIREFVYRMLTIEYKAARETFLQKNLFVPMKGALDAVLWLTSWNAACTKSSDPSAESFMWLAYSVSCKGGKSVLVSRRLCGRNKLCKGCTHDICKFHCNCNYNCC